LFIEERETTPVKDEGRQWRDGMQRRMRERKPNTLEKATSLIRISKNGKNVNGGRSFAPRKNLTTLEVSLKKGEFV
jgi:hypothetical protein